MTVRRVLLFVVLLWGPIIVAPNVVCAQPSAMRLEDHLERIEARASALSRQLLLRLDQARTRREPIATHCFDARLTEVHALIRILQRDRNALVARGKGEREARRVGLVLRVLHRRVEELTRGARRCDDPRGLRGERDFELEVTIDPDTPNLDPTVTPTVPRLFSAHH